MKIEFLKPAQLELDEAFEFYEFEQQGLGHRFFKEVKSAIHRIDEFPLAWQNITKIRDDVLCKTSPMELFINWKKRKLSL